ncbi:replication initiation protein [Arsenicibacter rosenii]|uniref:Initiator Rep protein WH1 domain-containing protein n=1 Tax=Arsenicibacter rosenii TaxID=1750698 RepID=A0A1S2VBK3_9BACT|nr:replication initiation protein [Arsenicibacter rosenii]OIN55596.1 hypothetical protein BLX24_29275 [Arsenicibacter rosenii]
MAKGKSARSKKDISEKYSIRIQGGKHGLVEASYKMDIMEFRIFATMLTMVLPEDQDFTEYVISVTDIIRLFNLSKSGQLYDMVRSAADKLLDRKFIINEINEDGIEYENKINMLASVKTPVSKKYQNHIKVTFHPDLKPYLLRLQKEYLTVDVRNIVDIQSPYSVKLYFVLKHQIKLGNTKVKYSLGRLRQIMTVGDDEYPLYGNFKQKILKKAQTDIEAYTDLRISEMEEEKQGRAVHAVIFHLENKQPARLEIAPHSSKPIRLRKIKDGVVQDIDVEEILRQENHYEVHTAPEDEIRVVDPEAQLLDRVRQYKVTKATVQDWLKHSTLEQIDFTIDYVERLISSGTKVKNIGGYLNKMVKTPGLFDSFKHQQEEQETRKKQKEQTEKRAKASEDLQQKRDELAEAYLDAKVNRGIALFDEQDSLARQLFDHIRDKAQAPKPSFMETVAWEALEKIMDHDVCAERFVQILEGTGGMTLKFHVLEVLQRMFTAEFSSVKADYEAQARGLGMALI